MWHIAPGARAHLARRLAGGLLFIALLLALTDGLATLRLRGLLGRRSVVLSMLVLGVAGPAGAAEPDWSPIKASVSRWMMLMPADAPTAVALDISTPPSSATSRELSTALTTTEPDCGTPLAETVPLPTSAWLFQVLAPMLVKPNICVS